jgi:hypothetical protein
MKEREKGCKRQILGYRGDTSERLLIDDSEQEEEA